jgi:hypothetical protein
LTSPAVIREEDPLDEFAAVLEEIFSRQPGVMVAPNRVIASGASATSTMASSDPTDLGHSPDRITARPGRGRAMAADWIGRGAIGPTLRIARRRGRRPGGNHEATPIPALEETPIPALEATPIPAPSGPAPAACRRGRILG